MASPAVVPPWRRSLMPVRSVIHSSVVSSRASKSALVTTLSGRAVPQPVMVAPADAGGHAVRAHAVRSQAMGWLVVTRSPATASMPIDRAGEGGADLVLADGAEDGAGHRRCQPAATVADGLEHPRGGADHEPLGGEEVLALVGAAVALDAGWPGRRAARRGPRAWPPRGSRRR